MIKRKLRSLLGGFEVPHDELVSDLDKTLSNDRGYYFPIFTLEKPIMIGLDYPNNRHKRRKQKSKRYKKK